MMRIRRLPLSQSLPLFLILLVLSTAGWRTSGNEFPAVQSGEQEIPGLGNPKIHKITEDVWGIVDLYHSAPGFYTNAGVVFTGNSVVFIDSGMTIASAEFIWNAAKERLRGDEELYLVFTHHHSDHIFGARVFKERGARIIGHTDVAIELADDNGFYKKFIADRMKWDAQTADRILGDVIVYVPDECIKEDTVLDIDGTQLQLLCTPGHTTDEIAVYLPKSKTLFAGDAIYEGSNLATRFGGPDEWRQWIAGLQRFKQLEIGTIVPGHGKICGPEEIDRNIDYLKDFLAKNN